MKRYIFFSFLIACSLTVFGQGNIYVVSAVKGTVTNISGKKIAVGEKVKLTDQLVFTSTTSLLILVHPTFGRVVATPNSNKSITAKNNLFTVLLKDILPAEQKPIKMAAVGG